MGLHGSNGEESSDDAGDIGEVDDILEEVQQRSFQQEGSYFDWQDGHESLLLREVPFRLMFL